MWEGMDPLHDRAHPEHTGYYTAGEPWRCHACTALDRTQRAYVEQDEKNMPGRKFSVELIDRKTRQPVPR